MHLKENDLRKPAFEHRRVDFCGAVEPLLYSPESWVFLRKPVLGKDVAQEII